MATIQISAHISLSTKELMERWVREHGVAWAYFIEQAVLHHLQAPHELPPDAIVPSRIVLTSKSGERVHDITSHPQEPTEAMKHLFHDR